MSLFSGRWEWINQLGCTIVFSVRSLWNDLLLEINLPPTFFFCWKNLKIEFFWRALGVLIVLGFLYLISMVCHFTVFPYFEESCDSVAAYKFDKQISKQTEFNQVHAWQPVLSGFPHLIFSMM